MAEGLSAELRSASWSGGGSQVLRFLLVGVAATLTHAAIVIVLMDGLNFPLASIANAVALVAGSAVSYLGNCRWTFRSRGPHAGRVARFAIAYCAVFLLGGLVMLLAADMAGVPYKLPLAAVVVATPVLTFLLNRFWVFAEA